MAAYQGNEWWDGDGSWPQAPAPAPSKPVWAPSKKIRPVAPAVAPMPTSSAKAGVPSSKPSSRPSSASASGVPAQAPTSRRWDEPHLVPCNGPSPSSGPSVPKPAAPSRPPPRHLLKNHLSEATENAAFLAQLSRFERQLDLEPYSCSALRRLSKEAQMDILHEPPLSDPKVYKARTTHRILNALEPSTQAKWDQFESYTQLEPGLYATLLGLPREVALQIVSEPLHHDQWQQARRTHERIRAASERIKSAIPGTKGKPGAPGLEAPANLAMELKWTSQSNHSHALSDPKEKEAGADKKEKPWTVDASRMPYLRMMQATVAQRKHSEAFTAEVKRFVKEFGVRKELSLALRMLSESSAWGVMKICHDGAVRPVSGNTDVDEVDINDRLMSQLRSVDPQAYELASRVAGTDADSAKASSSGPWGAGFPGFPGPNPWFPFGGWWGMDKKAMKKAGKAMKKAAKKAKKEARRRSRSSSYSSYSYYSESGADSRRGHVDDHPKRKRRRGEGGSGSCSHSDGERRSREVGRDNPFGSGAGARSTKVAKPLAPQAKSTAKRARSEAQAGVSAGGVFDEPDDARSINASRISQLESFLSTMPKVRRKGGEDRGSATRVAPTEDGEEVDSQRGQSEEGARDGAGEADEQALLPGEGPPEPCEPNEDETRVEEIRLWLNKLDGGEGALLQYLDVLKTEFDADFNQICAVRLNTCDVTAGPVETIDPFFWEVCNITVEEHKVILAEGINAL